MRYRAEDSASFPLPADGVSLVARAWRPNLSVLRGLPFKLTSRGRRSALIGTSLASDENWPHRFTFSANPETWKTVVVAARESGGLFERVRRCFAVERLLSAGTPNEPAAVIESAIGKVKGPDAPTRRPTSSPPIGARAGDGRRADEPRIARAHAAQARLTFIAASNQRDRSRCETVALTARRWSRRVASLLPCDTFASSACSLKAQTPCAFNHAVASFHEASASALT